MKKVYTVVAGVINEYELIKETEKTFKVRGLYNKWFETRVMKNRAAYPIWNSEYSTLCREDAIKIASEQIRMIDKNLEDECQRLCNKRIKLNAFIENVGD